MAGWHQVVFVTQPGSQGPENLIVVWRGWGVGANSQPLPSPHPMNGVGASERKRGATRPGSEQGGCPGCRDRARGLGSGLLALPPWRAC